MNHRPSACAVIAATVASLALTIAAPFAHAQAAWKPDKPIKLLVGFAPGGSADTLARMLAEALAPKLGQPVVVENVAGAGGNIMAARLAGSAADGHTLAIGAAGAFSVAYELNPKGTSYKPQSFAPLTMLATQPNVVLLNNAVPANNLAEFKAYVAKTPTASYGIAGIGISNHLIAEAMLHRLGVKMEAVPYKGAALVITDLLGGHIAMTVDNITTAAQLVKEGKVKTVGVTSAKRAAQLPDVPTLQEQGLAGFDMPTWQGLFAPAGLPPQVLAAYAEAMQELLQQPALRERMDKLGMQPTTGVTPAQFAAFLDKDRQQWAATIKAANIKVE
jgi:tripartite-type tricarboxylate transporter receptor subunit TctC